MIARGHRINHAKMIMWLDAEASSIIGPEDWLANRRRGWSPAVNGEKGFLGNCGRSEKLFL